MSAGLQATCCHDSMMHTIDRNQDYDDDVAGRESALGKPPVRFSDLEMHRIIGTGQFGMVRVVRHKKSGEVYALKVRALCHASCHVEAIRIKFLALCAIQSAQGRIQEGSSRLLL